MTSILDYLPYWQAASLIAGAFLGANMALLPSPTGAERPILPIGRFALNVGVVFGLLPIIAEGADFIVVLAAFVAIFCASFALTRSAKNNASRSATQVPMATLQVKQS